MLGEVALSVPYLLQAGSATSQTKKTVYQALQKRHCGRLSLRIYSGHTHICKRAFSHFVSDSILIANNWLLSSLLKNISRFFNTEVLKSEVHNDLLRCY